MNHIKFKLNKTARIPQISNQLIKSNHIIPRVTEFCHLQQCVNSQVPLKFYMKKYNLLKN